MSLVPGRHHSVTVGGIIQESLGGIIPLQTGGFVGIGSKIRVDQNKLNARVSMLKIIEYAFCIYMNKRDKFFHRIYWVYEKNRSKNDKEEIKFAQKESCQMS